MKLLIAPLLLSSVFAKPDSKAAKYGKAKFPKANGKAAKSAGYGRMSMSASMSVGPPPIRCGESFTNEKVVLSKDLNCGGPRDEGVDQQDCALTLVGPEAELNCNDFTLSQVATTPNYFDGPYIRGICLKNGAKAINCNVQRFYVGIEVTDGAEVVNSNLGSNGIGVYAEFTENSTLTIEDTDSSNNTNNSGLYIRVDSGGINAELIVKGTVTFNSNEGIGFYSFLNSDAKLEINVESSATLTTCENGSYDIGAYVDASATVTFMGTGYTCDEDKVRFFGSGGGAITRPVCQEACSST